MTHPSPVALKLALRFLGGLALAVAAGCGTSEARRQREAYDLFREAAQQAATGKQEAALDLYGQALTMQPSTTAYLARARLLLEMDREEEARADCEAGLKLNPDDRDLNWLAAELSKPEPRRFQGDRAEPPSIHK